MTPSERRREETVAGSARDEPASGRAEHAAEHAAEGRGASGAASAEIRERERLADDADVALAREGDHTAFRSLVERHERRAYALALRVLRHEEAARDAVQEAFLRVYSALRRFEGRSAFGTWLHRVVLNVCLDAKRRDRSSRELAWEDETTTDVVDTELGLPVSVATSAGAEPERALMRSELRAGLAEAIEALPEAARATLLLREVDGLSYAEIAQALQIPKGTVMSRLHYARRRVQELLMSAGVVEDIGARDDEREEEEGGGDDA